MLSRGPTVGALTMLSGLPGGGQKPVVAQSAPVVEGLETVRSRVGDSRDFKTAKAECPDGKKVVGGGGSAWGENPDGFERIKLTELRPSDDIDGHGTDGYVASAAETFPGVDGTWSVTAVAVCAYPWTGMRWDLNTSTTLMSTGLVKQRSVGCDNANQSVIGTGALIVVPFDDQGEVGLQVARVDANGNSTRAQAHVDASGYGNPWSLMSFAICANAPRGYQVVTEASHEAASEQFKYASVACYGKQMLSAGAAVTNIAPGHVSLFEVQPNSPWAWTTAVENTPTPQPWDVTIARAVCVDRP